MAAVKRLGYEALDVYLAWNYHELAPGQWDFSGQRDIAAFLDTAAAAGLLVVARPGPYICSEWDGGGLPAWLTTIEGLRLRQNEPAYLGQVQHWFDRVMPILAARQYPDGGPVILVQLDNELDFFDCDDPAGYIGHLASLARAGGIRVPLIACAGQGDIARATGQAEGVVPAVNLYPPDDSDQIEAQVAYYQAAVAAQGWPLLITETNRAHRTLKRLVTSGARLLGPYLQASGWNGDAGPAINNWGDPLAFMTHDYDFGGAIDPAGGERPDAAQARSLARIVAHLGERLAKATPGQPVGLTAAAGLTVSAADLDQGGQLLALANLGATPASASIDPRPEPVVVPPHSTVLVIRDQVDGRTTVTVEQLDPAAEPGLTEPGLPEPGPAAPVRTPGILVGQGPSGWVAHRQDSSPAALEAMGLYQGAGRYHATVAPGALGLVLRGAADVVDVSCGDWHSGWFANGGTDCWVELPAGAGRTVSVGTRIWGHSNFDDARLPSLRLGSLKGLTGLLAVLAWHDLSAGWTVAAGPAAGPRIGPAIGPKIGAAPPPRGGLGWMSGVYPQVVRYDRPVPPLAGSYAALSLPGLHARVDVALNDRPIGTLTPLSTLLWLGRTSPGDRLSLTVTKTWGEALGEVVLASGDRVDRCDITRQDSASLIQARDQIVVAPGQYPVEVAPGQARWLRLPAAVLAGGPPANRVVSTDAPPAKLVVRAEGEGLLLTALAGSANLGRLWLGPMIPGAQLRGGHGDLLLLPPDPLTDLDLLLEATGPAPGHLRALHLGGPVDLP